MTMLAKRSEGERVLGLLQYEEKDVCCLFARPDKRRLEEVVATLRFKEEIKLLKEDEVAIWGKEEPVFWAVRRYCIWVERETFVIDVIFQYQRMVQETMYELISKWIEIQKCVPCAALQSVMKIAV